MRWSVLALLACAAIVAYLTRASISPAGTTIQRDLGLTDVQLGYALSGFYFGYFWFQIPGGWLGNRLGARATLILFSVLWSAATLASALAHSIALLYWSRVAMGAAQAGLFCVIIMAVADWFPESRRGTAGAVITGNMSVGAVIAAGLTVQLLGPLGWRLTFETYALTGLVWAAVFFFWFRNRPEEHPAVNAAECKLIRARATPHPRAVADPDVDTSEPAEPEELSAIAVMARMLRTPSMVMLCVQSFFRAFGYALFITWFPAYLEEAYHVHVTSAGNLSMLPLAGVVIGSFVGGPIVDVILTRTGSRWLSRCGVAALALVACGLVILAATLVHDPFAAVVVIALGALLSGLGGPTTWAATMDISGRHSALGFALMNMAGNIGANCSPIITGYLIDSIHRSNNGHWEWVLYLYAGIYIAGGLSWLALDPNQSAVARASRNASHA